MSSSPRHPPPTPRTPSSPAFSQTSGYPFPDIRDRQPSSIRYSKRRGSASSTSSIATPSIGGSLDIQPRTRTNTLRETQNQNAISTLTAPPIVRTGLLPNSAATVAASGYKAPTTKDIPPVTLTNIEHVPPENFRDYLSRIGPLFEQLQRGRAEPLEGGTQWLKKDRELEKTDRFAEALERRIGSVSVSSPTTPLYTPTTTAGTLSPLGSAKQQRRRSSGGTARRNRHEPTPLSTIPPVYFEEGFQLENPRTFDVVSERAEISGGGTNAIDHPQIAPPPRKNLATNAILQEKLSWYMDTVEVHLINSISSASAGFFAALSSLKELQSEAEESVKRIQGLRSDLRRLDQEVCVSGLEVAAKRRRRGNLTKLGRAMSQVKRVVEDVKNADKLVEEGEFEQASEGMEGIGRLVCGVSEPGKEGEELIDLRPLKALQGLDVGLQDLQLRIGNGFANRFTTTLTDDLRWHVERVPKKDTLRRWSRQRGIQPLYMETDAAFRQKLLESLKGLQKAGYTAPAVAAYREAVNKEMKSSIRKYLPSSNDDDADSMVSISTRGGSGGKLSQQEKSSILARNLRAMDGETMEKLLIDVYTSVGEALRRVSTQTKILLDVTSNMQAPSSPGPKSPPTSPLKTPTAPSLNEYMANGHAKGHNSPQQGKDANLAEILDLSSLLEQATDTAQTQITRVLKVRNEQSIRLPKFRFLRYFTLNRLFADECEAISGRGGQALKGLINAQISGFVQVLGTAENERIAAELDAEAWSAVDFGAEEGKLLDRVLLAMERDPKEWVDGKAIWEDVGEGETNLPNGDTGANGETVKANGELTAPSAGKNTTKPAYIDETKYVLIHSSISLLPTIDTFLSLTATLPTMTPQISTSLLDVLRTFNSRSCQLILGAGATRSAGLKNITTKHLALASQSLSFIIALVPYMRECVRRHLPAGQMGVLAEFDKTKRLYQDHQSGIHDKLVEIMTGRSGTHVKSMKAMDFNTTNSSAMGNPSPSPYIETLTKETLTLHRVLSRHLSEGEVGLIMRRIFEEYKTQWVQAFGEVEVEGENGEKVLVRDAEAMVERLGKVEGFEGVGREILEAVRGRKTKVGGGGTGGGGKGDGEGKKEESK